MANRISRFALITGVAAVAAMPAVGVAYTLCGYKWAIRQVPYYINPANADVSASAAIAALQAGASAWSMQTNADFSFYYMGQTSGNTVARNGKNEVFFRNTDPGLTAEAYRYYDSNGRIVEFDIVLYDANQQWFTGSSGCVSGYYVEDTATHEFGHALGLKHSNIDTATMWSTATRCGTWKRSLAPDDIAGVEKMYPSSGSNTAPTVSIAAPANSTSVAEGTSLNFSGSASDKEDGTITSSLVWRSSRDGQIGTGASFSRVLSAGSHTITALATDSAGYSSSSQVALTISSTTTTTTNTAPSVTISAPTANLSVPLGTALTFSGTASDQQDGNLTSKLVWNSNLQGPLGLGGSFTKTLTAGSHTIKATVTDSKGTTTTKQVAVSVVASTGLTLSATGTKNRAALYAHLRWSGATSTKVDIYRDGVRVASTTNDGAHTDTIKKSTGTYTYKLCQLQSTICSADVVVRF